jgi:hypothetical protein
LPELDICGNLEILADEYFHGELPPEDKQIIDEHIKGCGQCAERFENERKYFEQIKLAAYEPEINIAESVMDKIISGRITVDKPAKKRYVPFGLISAAVIVLVMLIASRDNLYLINNNIADFAANESADSGGDMMIQRAFGGEWAGESDDGEIAYAEAEMTPADENIADEEAYAFTAEAAVMAAPAAAAAAPRLDGMSAEPGQIIRIKRGVYEDFDFPEYFYIGGNLNILADHRADLLENLTRHNIYYEIEDTGVDSDYIQIIYFD